MTQKLKDKLKQIDSDLLEVNAKIRPLSQAVSALREERQEILYKIEYSKKQPRVTDHAVIRLLERRYGFDFEEYRNQILDESAIKAINAGAQKIKRDGMQLIIKDKAVVTIL